MTTRRTTDKPRNSTRKRAARVRDSLTGLVQSALRTAQNTYFLLCSIGLYFAWSNAGLLKQIVAFITKLGIKTLADWVSGHGNKALGIAYCMATLYMLAPARDATMAILTSSAIIYYLKTPDKPYDYIGLVFGVSWFLRTQSRKIRLGIVACYACLYAWEVWGQGLG